MYYVLLCRFNDQIETSNLKSSKDDHQSSGLLVSTYDARQVRTRDISMTRVARQIL